MSMKNHDNHNQWRNITVAFRVSPAEDAQIETAVRLSGLTKQNYITRRFLCRDVVVQGALSKGSPAGGNRPQTAGAKPPFHSVGRKGAFDGL